MSLDLLAKENTILVVSDWLKKNPTKNKKNVTIPKGELLGMQNKKGNLSPQKSF